MKRHNDNSMVDMIAQHISQSGSSIFQIQPGLVICLDLDCRLEIENTTNNPSITVDEPNDKNTVTVFVGSIGGVLCSITILLLTTVTLTWVLYKR